MGKNNDEIEIIEQAVSKLLMDPEYINKKIAKVTDSWGLFVDRIVEPFIYKLFDEYGIKIVGTSQNVRSHRNGRDMGIDLLAVSTKEDNIVVAVEAKETLKLRDVNDFITGLNNFFDFFPVYHDRQLVGVVCGIRLIRDVAKYAERKGLYVLGSSDDNVMPLNKKNFKPKKWKN